MMLRNVLIYYFELDLLTVYTSANPFVGIKKILSELTKDMQQNIRNEKA